jgi:hypothetical protein
LTLQTQITLSVLIFVAKVLVHLGIEHFLP